MLSTDQLTEEFNAAGLTTPELLRSFLKPAAISAQLADFDGQIAAITEKRTAVNGEFQQQIEDLTAQREEVRRKLQGEK